MPAEIELRRRWIESKRWSPSNDLPPWQRKVVQLREAGLTCKEAGNRLNISAARVSQIHREAKRRLRFSAAQARPDTPAYFYYRERFGSWRVG